MKTPSNSQDRNHTKQDLCNSVFSVFSGGEGLLMLNGNAVGSFRNFSFFKGHVEFFNSTDITSFNTVSFPSASETLGKSILTLNNSGRAGDLDWYHL